MIRFCCSKCSHQKTYWNCPLECPKCGATGNDIWCKEYRREEMTIEDIVSIVTVILNVVMFVLMEYERRVGIPNYLRPQKKDSVPRRDEASRR